VSAWVVVVTKPNCEGMAAENLLQQGYGCYFPKFLAVQKNKQVVKKPLFPRYIFARIEQLWYSLRSTRGVSHVLMNESGPAQVPASVIEALKKREDGSGFIVLGKDKAPERFSKGSPVRASEGPLAGLDLIYDGMRDHDRVRVLATLLGRKVPVDVAEKILMAG
jgi:transcriptional antiterminator RfaH